jgi:hypothetical protein
MQFATIKGLRTEKYTLQSQNWRESAKTNKTLRLITARRNRERKREKKRVRKREREKKRVRKRERRRREKPREKKERE